MELYFYPETLLIENFKSIRRLELKLRPGVNLLVGPNASGKTNILEAIYSFHKALFPPGVAQNSILTTLAYVLEGVRFVLHGRYVKTLGVWP
ncbi:AAA family ATPase [Pyrobaculum aerophilum]|uniref:AAA family ATPase n=1 Tax=Pyrobaculum aerophilum TaxID=13773 RepID=UPI0023F15CD7|nr:AAA family ATPase [Pyrobaculum aerophilum]MCX8136723.1 AAA family ATPase [Pyrobaculum aerophilum]